MPIYPGTNIRFDLTIKIWRIPITIKGTIEPLAIMKQLGDKPKPAVSGTPRLRLR